MVVRKRISGSAISISTIKEGNYLFNDTLHTFFIFRLYGVGHMVKDHTDSERGVMEFGMSRGITPKRNMCAFQMKETGRNFGRPAKR